MSQDIRNQFFCGPRVSGKPSATTRGLFSIPKVTPLQSAKSTVNFSFTLFTMVVMMMMMKTVIMITSYV